MKKLRGLMCLCICVLVLSACDSSKPNNDTESPTATVAPTEADTPDRGEIPGGVEQPNATSSPEANPTETPPQNGNSFLDNGKPRQQQVAVVVGGDTYYGNRGVLNEIEQAIADGNVVEIANGSSLYLDGDDDRDTVTLEYEMLEDGISYTLTCGGVTLTGLWDGPYTNVTFDTIYAAKLCGTKRGLLDGAQLLIPHGDMEGKSAYSVFAYCHLSGQEILCYVGDIVLGRVSDITIAEDGFYYSKDLTYEGIRIRQKMTLCSGTYKDLLQEGEIYDAVLCEVPLGMYALDRILTLPSDIYVYEYRAEEPYAILPAGSTIACSATDGEEWFYFEGFYTDQSGWFRLEERGDLYGYVSAPEPVSLRKLYGGED